jgi:hypothetical protein
VPLDHLVPQQLAAALDVVGVLRVPTEPVALALAASGLSPGPEDGLDIVEEVLVDPPDADRHRPRLAHDVTPARRTGRGHTRRVDGCRRLAGHAGPQG